MSAEEVKPLPVVETPAVEATAAATETPAVEEPKVEEAKPTEETPAAATEAATEAPVEAAKEEAKPVEPKEEGHVLYHAPGNFLKEFLPIPPKKVFFWFGEEPVESTQLKAYLAKGKEAASSTAAWASQTGKGLLFFNKHGEDKAAPSGALNLADAEEIKESGTSEFTFKLHNHKHKFDAQTSAERDSWVVAVKKIAEEAKAKKDEILNSEGYKEALAKLKPAPIAAVTAPKVSEETPKKSTDTPVEGEETKKASKSRSRSRGPLGLFKSKKEEAPKEEVKEEETKEETPAVEAATTEAAPVEPVTDATAAPVITEAVPPVEEKKEETAEEAKEEPKKEGRRLSRFETFFKGKPKEAKKEEAAPVVEEPAKPAEEPVAAVEETPVVAEPVVEAAAATEEAPKEEAKEEEKKEETTPVKENRKSSFLTGLKGFTQKVRSPSAEHPPAVPAKDEAPVEAATETAAAEPAVEAAPATEAAVPAVEEPATNGETSKTEKRRSSFFNFGTINKKKAEAAPATEEPAKTEATEEAAAPAVEEPVVEADKPAEVEKPEASPKEHKESPFASIGRRVSKAIRGGDRPKKETKATTAVEEAKEDAKTEEATEAPAATLPEPIKVEEPATKPAAIGDVVPEAVTVGTAPTVSATA